MKIFCDVGGHYGETLDVALDPRWGFDRIYTFEPAKDCVAILKRFRDPRIQVVEAGLSNSTGIRTLYGAGLLGASVYPDKRQLAVSVEEEDIALVRASDWLTEHTRANDEIYMKFNCEGSECDIIEDLLDSGVIDRVRSLYVDFDARKIPSQAHRPDGLRHRLASHRVHLATPESLGLRERAAVRAWLTQVRGPAREPSARRRDWLGSRDWLGLRYRLGLHKPAYLWLVTVARATLPAFAFTLAARRFGAHARRAARQRRTW